MIGGSDLKAMYEAAKQMAWDNGAAFVDYEIWLEAKIAELDYELSARRMILERIVTAAQERGYEYNGWIDSLTYLTDLIDTPPTDKPGILVELKPYDE